METSPSEAAKSSPAGVDEPSDSDADLPPLETSSSSEAAEGSITGTGLADTTEGSSADQNKTTADQQSTDDTEAEMKDAVAAPEQTTDEKMEESAPDIEKQKTSTRAKRRSTYWSRQNKMIVNSYKNKKRRRKAKMRKQAIAKPTTSSTSKVGTGNATSARTTKAETSSQRTDAKDEAGDDRPSEKQEDVDSKECPHTKMRPGRLRIKIKLKRPEKKKAEGGEEKVLEKDEDKGLSNEPAYVELPGSSSIVEFDEEESATTSAEKPSEPSKAGTSQSKGSKKE